MLCLYRSSPTPRSSLILGLDQWFKTKYFQRPLQSHHESGWDKISHIVSSWVGQKKRPKRQDSHAHHFQLKHRNLQVFTFLLLLVIKYWFLWQEISFFYNFLVKHKHWQNISLCKQISLSVKGIFSCDMNIISRMGNTSLRQERTSFY